MTNQSPNSTIEKILDGIENLISTYMADPQDKKISNGNVAICIIDENGMIYGKMFGTNKPRLRQSYQVAWTKASQVWLTGIKTGEYEKRLFNGEFDENANGIEAPDLVGWVGGQPVALSNGMKLSVGFSGFRGTTDLEIVIRAIQENNL